MRKVLTFAAIVALVLAISSAADARGGGRGHGGGGFFGGGKTRSVGKAFHGGRTFHSGRTFRGTKKTVHGSKKTVDGGKTVHGGKKTVDGGKTNGSGKTAAGSTTTAGSKTTDGSRTADGNQTADSTNERPCWAGLTPGQAKHACNAHDASEFAHMQKSRGRLIYPQPETDQTNTYQTNNYASPDTGTGLVSDGAYRDPRTGLTTYSYHDPRTGLTYYRTDAQTVQPSNGATYRTPTMRVLDTLGSFVR
jgi:hypothetical protein